MISGTPSSRISSDSGAPSRAVVAEAIAARPHHQRVALMPDRRQEVAAAPIATAIRKASG